MVLHQSRRSVFVLRKVEPGALQRLLHVFLGSGVPAITAHGRRVPIAPAAAADAAHPVTATTPVPPASIVGPVRRSRARAYRALVRRLVARRTLRGQRVSKRCPRLVEGGPNGVDVVLEVVAFDPEGLVRG